MKKKKTPLSGGQQRPLSIDAYAEKMAKGFTQICTLGYHQHDVFDAFLDITLATLQDAPRHIQSAVLNQKLAEELPENIVIFNRVKQKFGHHFEKVYKIFAECFALLLESAETLDDQRDVLGEVYMTFSFPNKAAGQYFTPWDVCKLMVGCLGHRSPFDIVMDMIRTIREHDEAHALYADALMISSLMVEDEDTLISFTIEQVFPMAYKCGWEPVSHLDPACGSGRMLLAKAQMYPQWMLDASLVTFTGIDIDNTCCQMARINFILYGLNGSWVPWYLAMQGKSRDSFRQEMQGTDWDPDNFTRYEPKEKPKSPDSQMEELTTAVAMTPDLKRSMRTMARKAVKGSVANQLKLFDD